MSVDDAMEGLVAYRFESAIAAALSSWHEKVLLPNGRFVGRWRPCLMEFWPQYDMLSEKFL